MAEDKWVNDVVRPAPGADPGEVLESWNASRTSTTPFPVRVRNLMEQVLDEARRRLA
jgi:hypothetical protein